MACLALTVLIAVSKWFGVVLYCGFTLLSCCQRRFLDSCVCAFWCAKQLKKGDLFLWFILGIWSFCTVYRWVWFLTICTIYFLCTVITVCFSVVITFLNVLLVNAVSRFNIFQKSSCCCMRLTLFKHLSCMYDVKFVKTCTTWITQT